MYSHIHQRGPQPNMEKALWRCIGEEGQKKGGLKATWPPLQETAANTHANALATAVLPAHVECEL